MKFKVLHIPLEIHRVFTGLVKARWRAGHPRFHREGA